MLSFFGWIPVLGPIIQGIAGIFTGFFSKESTIATVEAQSSVAIIQATNNDIGLRLIRDALCIPVVAWCDLVGWDTIMAHHHPKWMWHVASYPAAVSYLPYAVIVFLLGNIGINTWSRFK
jgi:hypothetical protein